MINKIFDLFKKNTYIKELYKKKLFIFKKIVVLYIFLRLYKYFKYNYQIILIKILYFIPFTRKKIKKELNKSSLLLENDLDDEYENIKKLQNNSLKVSKVDEIINQMGETPDNKLISGVIYYGNKEHNDKLINIMKKFSFTNPLHPDMFPKIRNMEVDIINIIKDMYKGGKECCGNVTYGGTESLLLACLTYRDYYKNKGYHYPNIVALESVHPAFDKACHYFNIDLIKVPVDKSGTNTIDIIKRYINRNTILLVGSAPSYAHGIIDPIKEMSDLAYYYKIGFHVDCCMGGFLIPFLKEYNFINFKLQGITSISIDTHKYGYSLKGSSVLLFRNFELKKYQHFINKSWNGGVYATPTLMGSKSGALIAATWASLLFIGRFKYTELALDIQKKLRYITDQFKNSDLKIIGSPDLNIIAFSYPNGNIYNIINEMKKKKWNLTVMQNPSSFHLCLTNVHTQNICRQFCEDLNYSLMKVKDNPDKKLEGSLALYGSSQGVKEGLFIDEVIHDFIFLLSQKNISFRHK